MTQPLYEQLGVELSVVVPEPVLDPTLGLQIDDANASDEESVSPAHRLVTIGDSLTHGFQHGAIYNTDWSWPAIVARQLGATLTHPHDAADGGGGNPINLERVARLLGHGAVGDAVAIWRYARSVASYYGDGSGALEPTGPPNENLGVWG